MEASRKDLVIYQGRNFDLAVDIVDENGDPQSLSGYTGGQMQIRATAAATTVLATCTVTVNTTTGRVTASLTDDETALLTFVGAVYDLFITNGVRVDPIAYGDVTLRPAVTR